MPATLVFHCRSRSDGWFPKVPPDERGKAQLATVRAALEKAGRDPREFGIEPMGRVAGGNPERWRAHAHGWSALGATHLAIVTMGAGLASPGARG